METSQSRHPFRVFLLLSLVFLSSFRLPAQTPGAAPRIVQSINEKQLVTLKGNVHPLARPEFDQGPVPDSQPMKRILLLLQRSPEQEARLRQLLDDQQSKSSSTFHQWLTPEQFGAQFGPADSDLLAVTQWLASQGFSDINIGPGHMVIEFSGNVGQVSNAFHTDIRHFLVGAEDHLANSVDPQIPSALAPVVAGVVSLHNFPRRSHARILGKFRREAGKPGLTPLLTFPDPFNPSLTFYGMGPGDFATIYNSKPLLAAGNDGSGQTIAIVGQTNIKVHDVQMFRSMFGLPANFDSGNIILNGEDPGITSTNEEGEADLDVEWSGATAPGATVKFVLSASTPASAGIDLSALYIVEHNLAGVMSESYGECEAGLGSTGNAFYNSLWEQAAAQGITVIVSAGDGGSAGCDNFNTQQTATHGIAVSGLASTPFNVSLGGTDFDQVNKWTTFWNSSNDVSGTSAKSYIPEIPWNENCAQIGLTGCGASAPNGSLNLVAGSGGPSTIYLKPAWQLGVTGMPNDNHRDQPDVSLLASPGFNGTGYIYCQSDSTLNGVSLCDVSNAANQVFDFGITGGTSASAPAFAGVMALVNQKQATSSNPAPRQGNANYVLYALSKKSGASCVSSATEAAGCIFNDVTKGNSTLPTGLPGVGTNSVACTGGTPDCSVTTAASNGVLIDPSHPTTEAWTVTPGYDMVTGLGSLNVNNLASAWGTASTIATTTTLALSPSTGIIHGQSENVTIGVTVKPNTGTSVPAGNVSLIASLAGNATQGVDEFPLVNGAVTSAKTQNLPGGTYMVHAHYSGDGTNAPSDSPAVQVTVGSETSRTFIVVPSFDSSGNLLNGNATSIVYGSRYIIRMYVTNGSATASTTGPPSPTCEQVNQLTCPSGTITLTANGTPIDGGTFTLNNAGYTRDLMPTLTGGTYSLAAQYSGDSSYTSSSRTSSFTVQPDPVTFGLQSNPPTPIASTQFNLSIIAYSQYPAYAGPTGTVTYYDGTTQLGSPVPVSGPSGGYEPAFFSSANVMISTAGSHTISAKYSGDANYTPHTATTTVNILNPTTASVSFTPTTVNYGDTVTVTGTIDTSVPASNAALKPTGTVMLSDDYHSQIINSTTTIAAGPTGNWEIKIVETVKPPSSEGFTLSYSGDGNFAYVEAFSSLLTVIIPEFSLNVPSSPFNIPTGQSGSLQVNVTPATNNSSPVALSCNGNLPIGYACSLQPSTVNLANGVPSPVTLSLSPSPGAAVVPPAVVRKHSGVFAFPFGPSPRWPLSFLTSLAALLCVCCAVRKKNLRASLGFGLACIISLIIGCGGGSTVSPPPPPPPPPGPFATSTTVSTGSAKVAQGTSFTLTAKVSGQGNPSGAVNFYTNGSWIGSSNLTAGTATLSASLALPGLYSITAQYTGDLNNLASTSPGASEAITGSSVFQVNGQTSTLFHSVNVTVTLQ
jgi:subtilase family serine protease